MRNLRQMKGPRVLALSVIAVLLLASCSGGSSSTPAEGTVVDGVRRIAVELRNYDFVPKSFKFPVGEPVEFALTSVDIEHTFTIEELELDWQIPKPNDTRVHTLTFTTAGKFRLVCTIPSHEALGMVGTVVVE